MLDDGFNNYRVHNALKKIKIDATYDFIHDISDVNRQSDEYYTQGNHGAGTLSEIGGFDNGNFVVGYSREELLSMTPFDISDGQDFQYNSQMVIRLSREGNATFETTYIKKDGSHLPVEVSALRLTIDGKELYMAIARDITERKHAEEALRKSENLYRLLADNVHDMIWTTDDQLKPRYVSPSVGHLIGFPPEDAITAIYRHIILTSPCLISRSQLLSLTEDQPLHWESEIRTKKGELIWVRKASPHPCRKAATALPASSG